MININRPRNSPPKLEGTYYSRHREEILKKVSEYRKNNQEKIKTYMKKYQDKNKEKLEQYRQTYNQENIELQKEYFKKYNDLNKEKRRNNRTLYAQTMEGKFAHWKNGAIKRRKAWNLTIEELKLMPLKCHYTGFELTFESNKINTISLDRIDNSKGYNKDNVVFCMSQINIMKNSLNNTDFVKLCNMVVNHMHKSV